MLLCSYHCFFFLLFHFIAFHFNMVWSKLINGVIYSLNRKGIFASELWARWRIWHNLIWLQLFNIRLFFLPSFTQCLVIIDQFCDDLILWMTWKRSSDVFFSLHFPKQSHALSVRVSFLNLYESWLAHNIVSDWFTWLVSDQSVTVTTRNHEQPSLFSTITGY